MDDYKEEIKDIEQIEAANFTAHVKLLAHTTVISLRYLRHLSHQLEKPIEDLSVDDIIASLREADENARKRQP